MSEIARIDYLVDRYWENRGFMQRVFERGLRVKAKWTDPLPDKWANTAQAKARLHTSEDTLERRVKEKRLRRRKHGRRNLYLIEDLDKLVEEE